MPAAVPQAGGIAFRGSGRDLSILLVTSKKQPGFWIFPKGHIEPARRRRRPASARRRRKPASPATCSGPVGAPLEYDWDGKRYSVQYFLIRATAESPASDGRTIAWLPFEEALQRLSFDDTRRLLREARTRMDGIPRA